LDQNGAISLETKKSVPQEQTETAENSQGNLQESDFLLSSNLSSINQALSDFPSLFQTSKSINYSFSSTNLRETLTKWRAKMQRDDQDISNGNFIVAMILSGYKHKFHKKDSKEVEKDCYFNVKIRKSAQRFIQ